MISQSKCTRGNILHESETIANGVSCCRCNKLTTEAECHLSNCLPRQELVMKPSTEVVYKGEKASG